MSDGSVLVRNASQVVTCQGEIRDVQGRNMCVVESGATGVWALGSSSLAECLDAGWDNYTTMIGSQSWAPHARAWVGPTCP